MPTQTSQSTIAPNHLYMAPNYLYLAIPGGYLPRFLPIRGLQCGHRRTQVHEAHPDDDWDTLACSDRSNDTTAIR